jgi:SAM-dependent MidA family methyltransferase
MNDIEIEESVELKAEIVALIEEQGAISFARYMELCLYHPQHGYYNRSRTRIGRQGDFFTSSSVHSLFGSLIARQVVQLWQLMGEGPFTLIEQGAGEGYLCLDLLDALAAEAPELYARLEYVLVELSPDHRSRQRQRLATHVAAGRVSWCEFSELETFSGCFLSNELVDAFPVHLVEKKDGELQEVMVNQVDGVFVEELGPLTDSRLGDYFDLVQQPLVEGNRAEVNLASLAWIGQVSEKMERGALLTIDYGYPAAELLAPWRRAGTLLCYHRHQSSDNPYQHIGCQDMTAHVNFTLLEKVAAAQGFETLYFGEQYRFLMGLGFLEELIRLQALETDPKRAQALRMTLKNLILPDGGMGESFKVLLQGKGLGQPDLLCARPISAIDLLPGMM